MPLIASAVTAGVSALGKTGMGIGQLIHGNKLGKNNIRPEFDIQQEYFDNRDIAARMAQGGFTDNALDFYSDQAGRGLTSTTSAILQGGGGINAANAAFDQYLTGIKSVAAEDSILQTKNIMNFLDRNDTLAKQKVQKWVIDKYEPYKDKAQAAAKEKAAGIQNIFGGLSEMVGASASMSQSSNYEDLLNPSGGQAQGTGASGRQVENFMTNQEAVASNNMDDFFLSPFNVPTVDSRRADVARQNQEAGFDPSILSPELQEYYRILYKTN